ncbi:MAG: substrate-binding domain-containing protein [Clostridiales bacterium]|jgi:ribose transport system substrate-binding protein|nr:substrate-binding domain-containing protein [Clostridiales bacterium]OPZ67773.1 MAG: D-ribose-binding periplasmic protein precursor [Firmicutes bacterium ADurb.Bin467]
MKKLFALILGLALILTASFALAEDYTIYLVTMDQMDQHWVSVDEGCKAAVAEFAAKGININYKWNAPTNGKDDAAQIEIINNAYADNADAILLASNGPDTQVATIEELAADGVAFVYVDSPANSDVALQTICTDNTAAGKMAGETLLAALTAAGVTEGKIGIVNVNAATTSTVHREAGFRAAFEGTKFEIMETQYGEGDPSKSQEIATNFITDGAVALFGTNEGGTVGVGNAIAAEGETKVLGVGFDKSDAILNLVKTGALVATTAQNPYNMGYFGIQTAVEFLVNGTTEFEDIDSGAVILDAAAIG